MSALVVMMLLIFLLVIAFSLTIWTALTLKDRPLSAPGEQPTAPVRKARRSRRQQAAPTQEPLDLDPPPPLITNDEVRGARASVRQHVDPRITPHTEEVIAEVSEASPEAPAEHPEPSSPPVTTAPTKQPSSEPPSEAPPPKERPKFLEDAFERFAKTVEEGDF